VIAEPVEVEMGAESVAERLKETVVAMEEV